MRLSVIIPGYENPSWRWWRCVDSVLSVIGPEDEVICIDDGSRVKTLPDFANPRVRCITLEKNGGLARARNEGLRRAVGEFVTFVDSDDEVMNNVYSRIIAKMESSGSDIGIFGVKVDWVDDGLIRNDRAPEASFGQLRPADVADLRDRRLFNYSCNKVYRKSFLGDERSGLRFNPDGMPCEDILFNLACLRAGAKWCSVDCLGYRYNHTRHSLVSAYKPYQRIGMACESAAWAEYKASDPEAACVFAGQCEMSAAAIDQEEWVNIWRGTFSLREKLAWLKAHPAVGGVKAVIKILLYRFLRRYCYIRPVRRLRTMRATRGVQVYGKEPSGRRPVYVMVSAYFPTPETWRCAFIYDLYRAIQRTGKYRVVLVNTDYASDYTYRGAEVWGCPRLQRGGFLLGRLYDYINFRRTVRCLKRHGVDPQDVAVVHAHLSLVAGPAACFHRVNPNAKTLIHMHDADGLGVLYTCRDGRGFFNRIKRILNFWHHRRLVESVDAIVAISENVAKATREVPRQTVFNDYEPMKRAMWDLRGLRSPKVKRMMLLHNGVDLSIFNTLRMSCDTQSSRKFIIGCVGNFFPLKDQMTLLRAIVGLDVKVRFIGSGETLDECRRFTEENKIDAEFLPEVNHEQLPEFYRSLDLFVLPSLFEGYGCVFAEAAACGVPFLSCEGQGIEDIIPGEDRWKWLSPIGDSDKLRANIVRYMKNPEKQLLSEPLDIDLLVGEFLESL